MKTSISITKIYNLLVDIEGHSVARETVTSILYNILSSIQKDGFEITPELLDKRLEEEAILFINASKKDVA